MKTKIYFRVLRQSAEAGGKLYGIIDNANVVSPEVTIQEILDLKKLGNYSAKQLAALMEDIIQGAGELVARDGRPRSLSSLLKFEGKIRGTFDNPDERISTQRVIVRPRLLKDIKLDIDKSQFEFVNTNDKEGIVISSALVQGFDSWSASRCFAGGFPVGNLIVTGQRLVPTGWTEDGCKVRMFVLRNGTQLCRLDEKLYDPEANIYVGSFEKKPLSGSAGYNGFTLGHLSDPINPYNAWTGTDDEPLAHTYNWVPAAGDQILIEFERDTAQGPTTQGFTVDIGV